MSLRTKSRMPASTSETAARLESSSVVSIFSARMAFIGYSPVSVVCGRGCPPHDESEAAPSGLPILTASRPMCGNARSFPGIGGNRQAGRTPRLPAGLEPGAERLVCGPLRRFADRGRDAGAIEQFLFGADFAQPFVVGGRQRLASDETGAGI